MKLKTRMKSFWRHNEYLSMYMTMISMLITITFIIIGMPLSDIIDEIVVIMVWSLVWIKDRRIDYYLRVSCIVAHKAYRLGIDATIKEIKNRFTLVPKNNETEDQELAHP